MDNMILICIDGVGDWFLFVDLGVVEIVIDLVCIEVLFEVDFDIEVGWLEVLL